uniref:Uncharacterized protein n=1 Tax=Anguilla anguilla TaxID=7936 RepID=A0A0E9Q6B1_ANGAN
MLNYAFLAISDSEVNIRLRGCVNIVFCILYTAKMDGKIYFSINRDGLTSVLLIDQKFTVFQYLQYLAQNANKPFKKILWITVTLI